jgi:aspartate/tyrosine/aromatic aminotransferase
MSQAATTSFPADAVPQAPEDPLFGLMAAYRADTFDKKVDLGIGAYRDNNAKPWVLPVVKKVMPSTQLQIMFSDMSFRRMRSFTMIPP